jgi:Protein of unknown function (DUF2721)
LDGSLPVSDIANTIQASLAPVFLLAGIAGMLNVISTRLSRAIDRSRVVEGLHPDSTGEEHRRHVNELRVLDKRIRLANRATSLCVASALAICLVVTLMFVSVLAKLNIGDELAILFVVSMVLLAGGLISFLFEVRTALSIPRVREDLLEREQK